MLAAAEAAALDAEVHLLENLADADFVTGRFRVVRSRGRTTAGGTTAEVRVPGVPVPDVEEPIGA